MDLILKSNLGVIKLKVPEKIEKQVNLIELTVNKLIKSCSKNKTIKSNDGSETRKNLVVNKDLLGNFKRELVNIYSTYGCGEFGKKIINCIGNIDSIFNKFQIPIVNLEIKSEGYGDTIFNCLKVFSENFVALAPKLKDIKKLQNVDVDQILKNQSKLKKLNEEAKKYNIFVPSHEEGLADIKINKDIIKKSSGLMGIYNGFFKDFELLSEECEKDNLDWKDASYKAIEFPGSFDRFTGIVNKFLENISSMGIDYFKLMVDLKEICG